MAPWGSTALYDLVLRSIGMLGQADGPKSAGRVHRRRRSGQPRDDRGRRARPAVERRDALHDRPGARRHERAPQSRDVAAGEADRRPRDLYREHRRASRGVRGAAGRVVESVSARLCPGRGTPRRCLAQHQGRSRRAFRNSGPSGLQTGAKQMKQDIYRGDRGARRTPVPCGRCALWGWRGSACSSWWRRRPRRTLHRGFRRRSTSPPSSTSSSSTADGQPITGLGEGDFNVRIDGRERQVLSAEWVEVVEEAKARATAVPVPAGYTSNENTGGGRLIVIVSRSNSASASAATLR